MKSNIQWKQRH